MPLFQIFPFFAVYNLTVLTGVVIEGEMTTILRGIPPALQFGSNNPLCRFTAHAYTTCFPGETQLGRCVFITYAVRANSIQSVF